MSTYQELIPDFLKLFTACAKDYRRFYRAVESMHNLAKQSRVQYLRQSKCMPIGVETGRDQY